MGWMSQAVKSPSWSDGLNLVVLTSLVSAVLHFGSITRPTEMNPAYYKSDPLSTFLAEHLSQISFSVTSCTSLPQFHMISLVV